MTNWHSYVKQCLLMALLWNGEYCKVFSSLNKKNIAIALNVQMFCKMQLVKSFLYFRISKQTIEFESLFVGDLDVGKIATNTCETENLEGKSHLHNAVNYFLNLL